MSNASPLYPQTGFLDLLAGEIAAAEQAAAANDRLGRTDLAESFRRRVDHLWLYLDGARLAQTEPSPGLV
jgi:hypothetical protein